MIQTTFNHLFFVFTFVASYAGTTIMSAVNKVTSIHTGIGTLTGISIVSIVRNLINFLPPLNEAELDAVEETPENNLTKNEDSVKETPENSEGTIVLTCLNAFAQLIKVFGQEITIIPILVGYS